MKENRVISINDLCPSCGRYVPEGHSCSMCAKAARESYSRRPRTMSPRARRRGWIVFVIEVLLVAAMLFVIIYGPVAAAEAICRIGGV